MKTVTPKTVFRFAVVVFAMHISYRLYELLQVQTGSGRKNGQGGRRQHPQAAEDLDEVLEAMFSDVYDDSDDTFTARRQQNGRIQRKDDVDGDVLRGLSEQLIHDRQSLHKQSERDVEGLRVQEAEDKRVPQNVIEDDAEAPQPDQPQVKTGSDNLQQKPEGQDTWALEEELKKRRKKYLADVEKRAEQFQPEEFRDFHEKDDHLAFVTVGTDRSWAGVLQFVHSVQYHYPGSSIGIFDLGFSQHRRLQLETFCNVIVLPVYLQFWPKHMMDLHLTLYRPILWQMGLTHFGHIVFVEPDRFLMTKTMKQYIDHSRRFGVTVVGKKLQYSPYVVTNPEMYFFLQVDTRKLQRVEMFDVSMVILHNSQPVRHHLMRYLVACVREEYCIAPPRSKLACDHNLYPGSKKYANCHRYDLSAINILLYKWFDYSAEQFLVRDMVTAHYDGKDVSHKVKVCPKKAKEEM